MRKIVQMHSIIVTPLFPHQPAPDLDMNIDFHNDITDYMDISYNYIAHNGSRAFSSVALF